MSPDAKAKQLIVALDVSTQEKAIELVRILKDQVGYFKIGLQLFTIHRNLIEFTVGCQYEDRIASFNLSPKSD